MSQPFLGQITIFAGTFAPRGYALCNGQILSISQNTPLFSLLGTTYGGNGTSTFALPNLQGMYPMHFGSGVGLTQRVLGETGGETSVILTPATMPYHTHDAVCVAAAGNTDNPVGAVWAEGHFGKTPVLAYKGNSPIPNATMNPAALSTVGGNQPHNNLNPYVAITFIIALQGIFPSRN
jgi:microcystin-dependent protein